MLDQPRRKPHIPNLMWFALAIALIGIVLRWYNLDYKVFGHDEVFTAIRATGHTPYLIVKTYANQFITAADLGLTQQIESQFGWAETWNSLVDHPEHPPLYYLVTRFWMSLFGGSIFATRTPAVLFSLLSFPALYWLCRELFNYQHISQLGQRPLRYLKVEWIAISLFALSPFHVLFAQEARQYSLWTTAAFAATAALVRALRRQTIASWGIYAVLLSLNYYASLLSAPMAIAHALYVFLLLIVLPLFNSESSIPWQQRFRQAIPWRTVCSYAIAGISSVVLFIPWLWVLLDRWDSLKANTNWMIMDSSLESMWFAWRLHLSSVFVDLFLRPGSLYLWIAPTAISLIFLWGCITLIRRTPFQVWGLLLTTVVVTWGSLIVSDVLMNAIRSKVTRYFVPALAMQLVIVAFGLAVLMQGDRPWRRQLGRFTFAILLSASMLSCSIVSQQSSWWNKPVSLRIPNNAHYLSQLDNPTLVTDLHGISLGNTIALSRLVPENTRFYIIDGAELPPLEDPTDNVFLFDPSSSLKERIVSTYPVEIIDIEGRLKQLVTRCDTANDAGNCATSELEHS